ncbi:hypothetical protein J45TS6_39330 [Paenibacillus sp. J45TS6]|nr:hypothetical protein J45TS6_39330 [Paenibacillus sp. J45TS6]
MRLKICMLIFLFILSGCNIESEETNVPPENLEPTSIKLTPIDLFDGEAGKFKNFLGSMSGGIKLEYEGSKPNASLDIDIWENGKKVDTAGSIGDLFYSLDEQKRSNEVEIIISIDTVNFEGQNEYSIIKVNKVRNSGSSLSTVTLPWNKELTLRGCCSILNPTPFLWSYL